jgi:ribosomal-protein-alanine N-acetyltransferase
VAGRIRPLAVSDAEALAALYARNRSFLAPFEPEREDAFFTPAGQRARLSRDAAHRYAILDGDAIAGVIAIQNVVRGAAQAATIGYWVDEARNGRGLATGAVAAAMGEAFGPLALHRLSAPVQVDNLASQRVLERNGFERIGLAREYLHVGGAWRDHLLYQRLRDA